MNNPSSESVTPPRTLTPEEAAALDPEPLRVIGECMNPFGVAPNHPDNEWPYNILSLRTIAFGSGRLARQGDEVVHDYDPADLAVCRSIAAEAVALVAKLPVKDPHLGEFVPLCLPANRDDPKPSKITEAIIRDAFRGTLHPWVTIQIESLSENQIMGNANSAPAFGWSNTEERGHNAIWKQFRSWFSKLPELRHTAVVTIEGGMIGPRSLRMVLGLTRSGSLTGIASPGPTFGGLRQQPSEMYSAMLQYEQQSTGRWQQNGRNVARVSLKAIVTAELDSWFERMSKERQTLRGRDEPRFMRVRFREVPVRFQVDLDTSWEAVHRCLTNGRFSMVHGDVLNVFYEGHGFGFDDTGDVVYTYQPHRVVHFAERLSGLDAAWLRSRYHDLRATDYADRRSDDDLRATLDAFEKVKEFYSRAAVNGLTVTVVILKQSEEQRQAEAEAILKPKPKKIRKSKDSARGTDCEVDDERLIPLVRCLDAHGMDDEDPQSDWPHNSIAKNTVAYACGIIAREGEVVRHDHDPKELDRCEKWAKAIAQTVKEVQPAHDQGGPFVPFWIPANIGDPVPEAIDEDYIRQKFGGTIYPENAITIEPMAVGGSWWNSYVENHLIDEERQEQDRLWRGLVDGFAKQKGLHGAVFVKVGLGDDDRGPCHPRLVVALTEQGSLVGVCGYVIFA